MFRHGHTVGLYVTPSPVFPAKQCYNSSGIFLALNSYKVCNFKNMILEKYNPAWVADFTAIKNEIEAALNEPAFTIEHVGSTAVPNLDSKPVIDIDIIYYAEQDFERIKTALEKAGYYHNGNQGIEGRDVFKRNGKCTNKILDSIKHHLYVCPTGSKALERHMLSRNFLRKHAWARIQYQDMKYRLAAQASQDKKLYASLKELHVNDFINSMIEQEKQTTV